MTKSKLYLHLAVIALLLPILVVAFVVSVAVVFIRVPLDKFLELAQNYLSYLLSEVEKLKNEST